MADAREMNADAMAVRRPGGGRGSVWRMAGDVDGHELMPWRSWLTSTLMRLSGVQNVVAVRGGARKLTRTLVPIP